MPLDDGKEKREQEKEKVIHKAIIVAPRFGKEQEKEKFIYKTVIEAPHFKREQEKEKIIHKSVIKAPHINLNFYNEENEIEKGDLLNTSSNIIQKERKNFLTLKKKNSPKDINYYNENFRAELKETLKVVAESILNKYDLKSIDKKSLINLAFEIFDYAVINKGMKPNDLGRNKGSRYLSIILIYYTLVNLDYYQLGNEFLTGKLVAKSVDNYSELGFKTRETMEGHITAGKFYKFLTKETKNKIDNLPSFKKLIFNNDYRFNLIQNLEIAIPEILNFYSLTELNAVDVKKSALKIYDDMINNGMTQNKLSVPFSSNKMALVLIFYALLDSGVKSLGFTSIGQADIGKALLNMYNKLNFSNSDLMIYLKPKIIYEFLPDRLRKLLDSLPSPKLIIFNQYYENEMKKYLNLIFKDITAKYSISVINGNSLENTSLTLFNQALENELTPGDLKKSRKPNQLALILIYFTLIHYEIYNLGGKIISISSIIDSINDLAKLNFKNKESAYNVYPTYLLPFLPKIYAKRVENLDDTHKIFIEYNQNFRKKLENYIRFIAAKIMSVKYLEGIKLNNIINESLRLFDIALKNGLKPDDLEQYRFARHLSICLIYFSLISHNVISLGSGALSVRDITNIIAEDYHRLGFGSEKATRFGGVFLSKFMPDDVLDKADKIPQTIGIVFNDDYLNNIENYVAFIADYARNNYKLNINIKDLTSLAIKILEDCIKNGLEPSDLGDNKRVSFMSIILSYYALISLKITKLGTGTITLSKIIDLLMDNYEQIGFSSFWFSDKVVAGRIYSFLPEDTKKIVDLLPERELPIGKYESICKRFFDEVFSEFYNMKIKFIPHLSLYKIISDVKNNYLSEYIKRAHADGAFKVPLPKNGINKLKHRLHINIDIPRNINEIGYNIDHIDSLEIQRTIEKIKDDFVKNDLKLIKIQFTIGHIKIFIKNGKMILLEREIYIPLTLRNENIIWVVYEYNGIQHYTFPNYFHKNLNDLDSFLNGIFNDLLKSYLLIDNGIILIEFPYWVCPKMNNPNRIKNFIKNKVKSNFRFS
ncbi:MAG: hypothetical protein V3V33_00605 [Candidatus Lokiarchaeia archaeon]